MRRISLNVSTNSFYASVLDRMNQYRSTMNKEKRVPPEEFPYERLDMEKFEKGREEFQKIKEEIIRQERKRLANIEQVGSIKIIETPFHTLMKGYRDYFSFIDESNELSDEEKQQLRDAIKASITFSNNSFRLYPMQIEQSKLELQLLAKYALPESLKEKMNQAIERYAEEKKQANIEIFKEINLALTDQPTTDSTIRESIKKDLNALDNGTHEVYEIHATFEKAFSNVFNQPASSVANAYEDVLELYYNRERANYGSRWDSIYEGRTKSFIGQLNYRWNQMMSRFEQLSGFQTGTEGQSLIDVKV